MSTLSHAGRRILEEYLQMSGGYVLDFTDATLETFVYDTVGVWIHDEKYTDYGSSKAKKLREFWRLESDQMAGKLLQEFIE